MGMADNTGIPSCQSIAHARKSIFSAQNQFHDCQCIFPFQSILRVFICLRDVIMPGRVLGQRVHGVLFQDAQMRAGDLGREVFGMRGQAVGVFYIEAYYNRVRMYSVLDNVAPGAFHLHKAT